ELFQPEPRSMKARKKVGDRICEAKLSNSCIAPQIWPLRLMRTEFASSPTSKGSPDSFVAAGQKDQPRFSGFVSTSQRNN
ncbi:TPA: hypothetical protein ACGOSQ_001753, partial [Streptococcus suis]